MKISKLLWLHFVIISCCLIVVIVIVSCKKIKGDEECTWPKEITNMRTGICKMQSPESYDEEIEPCTGLFSYDTCKFNLIKIRILFDYKYLSQKHCSTPYDSILGRTENLFIICENDYNNTYKAADTINDIIKIIYTKQNGMLTMQPVLLNDYLLNKPICSDEFNLFITQAPDTTALQSFKIIYIKTDGSEFSATSKPIYITP